MKKTFLFITVLLVASASFAETISVGEHVRFAIQKQLSTFKLETWVSANDKIEPATCIAIGEFKQQIDKIYELAQVAYLSGEMDMSVRTKADELARVASSLLPFCGVNKGMMPKETYRQIVEKAKVEIASLQDSVQFNK